LDLTGNYRTARALRGDLPFIPAKSNRGRMTIIETKNPIVETVRRTAPAMMSPRPGRDPELPDTE
jgi:hypothetical protein